MNLLYGCFRYHKGTDFQANHNSIFIDKIRTICCFRYHKGTDFQANHNLLSLQYKSITVVLDTTKVQIFKQITTSNGTKNLRSGLFQIPQRYRFSSKSQLEEGRRSLAVGCFRYHKGTDFQANHNPLRNKVYLYQLFQIPQRYRFSSKSQRIQSQYGKRMCCFRYHKGTDFQANHNNSSRCSPA